MQTITLSEAALATLRLHVEQDNIRIDDSNREGEARTGTLRANGGRGQLRLGREWPLPTEQGRPRSG